MFVAGPWPRPHSDGLIGVADFGLNCVFHVQKETEGELEKRAEGIRVVEIRVAMMALAGLQGDVGVSLDVAARTQGVGCRWLDPQCA